jgi:hypothetical protein
VGGQLLPVSTNAPMFFTFPDGMPTGRLLSLELKSANTTAWYGYLGACSSACCRIPPIPERCVEAYHLQRTRFERAAERKMRRRQLTEDGNVEITGRDLREGSPIGSRSAQMQWPQQARCSV